MELDGLVEKVPRGEKIIIRGDLNGHMGGEGNKYRDVHGDYWFGERNNEGKAILDFVTAYVLILANTRLKKRNDHFITYKNGI